MADCWGRTLWWNARRSLSPTGINLHEEMDRKAVAIAEGNPDALRYSYRNIRMAL
jgi:hypothetical protein